MNSNPTRDPPREISRQLQDLFNVYTHSETSLEPSTLLPGPPTLPSNSAGHVPTHPITSHSQGFILLLPHHYKLDQYILYMVLTLEVLLIHLKQLQNIQHSLSLSLFHVSPTI